MLVYFLINLSQRGIPIVESGVPIIKPNSAPWLIALPLMDTVTLCYTGYVRDVLH
jgi:hypothetical protein